MTNETDMPHIFAGGFQPIGRVNGTPVASKKHAGGLMKRIMSLAKPAAKATPKSHKGRTMKGGKIPRRGIEADSKVRFGSYPKYY